MPNGHLDIGNGIGEASDWNTNPAVQNFVGLLQQQKAQKQAQQQALVSQLASLNPNGIRDADKPDYQNKYNDWKQSVISANNLPRNSPQRLQALADAQNKYDDVNEFIGSSKKEALNEHAIGNQWINNPHLFSDTSHQQLLKSLQSPMSSGDFIPGSKYQTLDRYVDHAKVDDAFDKANQVALKQSAYSNPIQSMGHDKQGNKTGVVVHNEREVAPEDLMAMAAHMYDVNDNVKASIDKRYANITGSTPQDTKMLRIKQNALDRGDLVQDPKTGALTSGVNESTKPEFKADRVPRAVSNTNVYMAGQPVPSVNIPYGQHAPGANPAKVANVNLNNYVGMSIPGKNFAGIPAYDLGRGGLPRPLESSGDYSMVGVANAPFIKKGYQLEGTLAQPDFAASHPEAIEQRPVAHVKDKKGKDYLFPYSSIPANVSGTKSFQAYTSNFQPAQSSQQPIVTKPSKLAKNYGL